MSVATMTAPVLSPATDRAAWLEERRHGIGSSEIAAIFGVSPWLTAFDLWLSKREGAADDDAPTADQIRGTILEGAVLELYAVQHDVRYRRNAACIVSPHDPVVRATPDAFVLGEDGRTAGVIEAKTSRTTDGWAPEPTGSMDDVPPWYALQAVWHMAATGLPWCDIVVLLPFYELRTYRIERDERVIEHVTGIAREWWDRFVVGGEQPPMGDSDLAYQWLRDRYPRGAGLREATAEEVVRLLRYDEVRRQIDALETEKRALRNEIVAAIADAAGLTWPGGEATWGGKEGARALRVTVRE